MVLPSFLSPAVWPVSVAPTLCCPLAGAPQTPAALVALPCPLPRRLARQTLGGGWTHYPSIYCPRRSCIEIKLVTDPGGRWTYFCSEPKVRGDSSVLPRKQPVTDGLRVRGSQGPSGSSAAPLPAAPAPQGSPPLSCCHGSLQGDASSTLRPPAWLPLKGLRFPRQQSTMSRTEKWGGAVTRLLETPHSFISAQCHPKEEVQFTVEDVRWIHTLLWGARCASGEVVRCTQGSSAGGWQQRAQKDVWPTYRSPAKGELIKEEKKETVNESVISKKTLQYCD